MEISSSEYIIKIQFNALMMTVIKCTVKNKQRELARHSKHETFLCQLPIKKQLEYGRVDTYSCDYFSFKVLNYTIQVSSENLANALSKLAYKQRSVILLCYFQEMSAKEISELYHVSRSAVYHRRNCGLKKLKALLEERD